jgi:uncharacterized protein YraI
MTRLTRFFAGSLMLVFATAAFPALARAAAGYVTGNVNLRAGPDTSYPLIDLIPAGTGVNVQGCTDGWEWCDVIVSGNRGWVAGNYIEYVYQDQPVLLPSYGAQIGIPIVSFVIGTYWDSYYRNRPFYSQRNVWYHRRIVRRPPPPPMHRPYRPGHGRPVPGRPGWNGHRPPPSGTRPGRPPSRPATPIHRPAPPQGQRPPQGRPSRPAPAQRPQPTVRPAPGVRPATAGRPSPGAGRHAPAKNSGHARPTSSGKDPRGH